MDDIFSLIRSAEGSFKSSKFKESSAENVKIKSGLIDVQNEAFPMSFHIACESNIIVCEYLWEKQFSQPECSSKILEKASRQLEEQLFNIRSLPVNKAVLHVELVILYNWLHTSLLQTRNLTSRVTSVQNHSREHVTKSLYRVFSHYSKQKEESKSHEQIEAIRRGGFQYLADLCLNITDDGGHFTLVCACLILVSFLNILFNETEDAFIGLQSVREKCDRLKIPPETVVPAYLLPWGELLSEIVYSDLVVSTVPNSCYLSDFVSLLMGVLKFQLKKPVECLKHLNDISTISDFPGVVFIKGFLQFEAGEYEVALSDMTEFLKKCGKNLHKRLRATLLHLSACCCEKMEKLHLAMKLFQESLRECQEFYVPLYNISCLYRRLGLQDAELEALNLLVTILEDASSRKTSRLASVGSFNLLKLSDSEDRITLPWVLYTLANRCMELGRYSAAAERFLTLIALLSEPEKVEVSPHLPSISKIYMDTASTLLSAQKYEDCVLTCDHILTCTLSESIQEESLDTNTPDLSQHSPIFTRRRKRPRLRSMDLSQSWPEVNQNVLDLNTEVRTLMCKAEALFHLGEATTAVTSLQNALDHIQENLRCDDEMAISSLLTGSQSRHTRFTSYGPDNTEPVLSTLSALVYQKLGAFLACMSQFSDALHYLRLGLQINSEDEKSMFNLTLVLFGLKRSQEAAYGWLKSRAHDCVSMSQSQLMNKLKEKQSILRSMSAASDKVDVLQPQINPITDRELLLLDITCLEEVIKDKHRHPL
ncbi:hypothetical protein CHS0354_035402 [Potamilus streckersoni]|uniref:Uncharacterized protein n=1 Tax=Potamilus streckersoni TaxID=2493646 RepID=A0AAE0TEG2_9BIVA|nr:hypothetical protein CHS0354_035402 [Potamilus streckersoni]